MAKNNKIDLNAPNLLTVNAEAVEKAFRDAVKAALLKHKQSNNPAAIWRGGKVVLLSPDEITTGKQKKRS